MSSGGQRPPPNRMTLMTFKARLGGATKGHSLLKKKRDALKAKFQSLLKDIVETKMLVGNGLRDASFTLAKVHWANSGEDITSTVVERAKKPSVAVKLTGQNIAGVSIAAFSVTHDPSKDQAAMTLGCSHGGAVINACRQEYFKALIAIVRLASLQAAFKSLDHEIKMTSRRVNALEYVLIPRIQATCKYIELEMDEESREEFFRVKKVVEKKKAKLAREKLEDDKHKAAEEARKEGAGGGGGGGGGSGAAKAPAAEATTAAAEAAPAPPPPSESSSKKEKKKKGKDSPPNEPESLIGNTKDPAIVFD